MRVIVFVVAALACMLLGAEPAAACSVGPDFDPVRETDVFVIGRVAAVAVPPPPTGKSGQIRVATVTLDEVTVLKGTAARRLTVLDPGAGDGCSALEGADPTTYVGRYAALALKRVVNEEGGVDLVANRLFGAAFGAATGDPGLRALVARHGLLLPSTSTRGAPSALAGVALVVFGCAGLALTSCERGRSASRDGARPRASTAR